jgi:hypothetical protein
LFSRFCLECKNFEDRGEIEGVVVCARGHYPGVSCPDFKDKHEGIKSVASKTRFCIECENFEDRTDIRGVVVCAKGHYPGVSCQDFQDRVVDIFYSYIYWSYLYSIGSIDEGKDYFEEMFSKKLSAQELAYACLIEYFDLGLDYSDFCRCWSTARKIYRQKMPIIPEILDGALERFNSHGQRMDLKRVFLDLLYGRKTAETVIKETSEGLHKI